MNPQSTFKNKSEFGQIGQILQKFLAYWPIFLISVTMAIAIAYIKLRAEQPVYVAYAKILLKDPSKGSKVLDEFNIMEGKQIVENEILVLKSAGLMQEVVRRLGLSPTVFNEGRVRVEELYKDNSPVSFVPIRRDSIYDGGKFYFDVDWSRGEVNIAEQKNCL